MNTKTISAGDEVTIVMNDQSHHYRLVNDGVGDPKSGRLSVDSPLGNSLIGRRLGESFYFSGPRATMFEVKILAVHPPAAEMD